MKQTNNAKVVSLEPANEGKSKRKVEVSLLEKQILELISSLPDDSFEGLSHVNSTQSLLLGNVGDKKDTTFLEFSSSLSKIIEQYKLTSNDNLNVRKQETFDKNTLKSYAVKEFNSRIKKINGDVRKSNTSLSSLSEIDRDSSSFKLKNLVRNIASRPLLSLGSSLIILGVSTNYFATNKNISYSSSKSSASIIQKKEIKTSIKPNVSIAKEVVHSSVLNGGSLSKKEKVSKYNSFSEATPLIPTTSSIQDTKINPGNIGDKIISSPQKNPFEISGGISMKFIPEGVYVVGVNGIPSNKLLSHKLIDKNFLSRNLSYVSGKEKNTLRSILNNLPKLELSYSYRPTYEKYCQN